MSQTGPDRRRHEPGDVAQARIAAARAEATILTKAARTVADNSLDAHDRDVLLSMLGLPMPDADTLATPDAAEIAPAPAAHHSSTAGLSGHWRLLARSWTTGGGYPPQRTDYRA